MSEPKGFKKRYQSVDRLLGAGELEQLGFDLDDIHATISMVESNRHTFQLSDVELSSRKRFVLESRKTLDELQKDVRGPQTRTKLENDKKVGKGSCDSLVTVYLVKVDVHETWLTC